MHAESPTVLLIGAAHGIGRAAALQLAARGAKLAACDIDVAGLESLKAELPAGAQVLLQQADVTSAESLAGFVAATEARFGPIDSAICNAGGMISLVHEGQVASNVRRFADTPPADWKKIVDLNLYGVLNMTHAVLPGMAARGRGRMVYVASVSGLVGSPGLAVYSAAKGGVIAFAKSMARELGENGISVNCVAPGGIATRAFSTGSASVSKRLERVALGRLGQPEEVANVITYMALDAPPYLTGETVSVSGGPP
ncbi:MAG: SDR family oxidoreductase [Burkholderiales bacterium]|nr:SDR family oxidoreductase [Burkholderiales bacterium]